MHLLSLSSCGCNVLLFSFLKVDIRVMTRLFGKLPNRSRVKHHPSHSNTIAVMARKVYPLTQTCA